jgi:hypothetical protein
MSYVSGGLEEPAIREAVCAILEGGKRAFQEHTDHVRSRPAKPLRRWTDRRARTSYNQFQKPSSSNLRLQWERCYKDWILGSSFRSAAGNSQNEFSLYREISCLLSSVFLIGVSSFILVIVAKHNSPISASVDSFHARSIRRIDEVNTTVTDGTHARIENEYVPRYDEVRHRIAITVCCDQPTDRHDVAF